MATITVRGVAVEVPDPANTDNWKSAFVPILQALAANPLSDWTPMTFEGDWVNIETADAARGEYCSDGVFAYLKGSIIAGTGDITVLPEALWPDELLTFPTNKLDSTVKADLITVDVDGTVALVGAGGAAVEVYLGLISYRLP